MTDLHEAKPNNKALSGQRLDLLWFGVSRSALRGCPLLSFSKMRSSGRTSSEGSVRKTNWRSPLRDGTDGDRGLFSAHTVSYLRARLTLCGAGYKRPTQRDGLGRGGRLLTLGNSVNYCGPQFPLFIKQGGWIRFVISFCGEVFAGCIRINWLVC